MKYYLHIYVDEHLELQSIHNTKNDAIKEYIEMRRYYPSTTFCINASTPKGIVTWEIIEIERGA